jgi:hypothetical protein
VAKDGSGIVTLAKFDGTYATENDFSTLVSTPVGLLFSRRHGPKGSAHDTLLRVSRDGGPLEIVAERFGWLGAEHGGYLYGVDYDYWGGSETVVRMPVGGGEVTTLYQRSLKKVGYGTATYRFHDMAVDGSGVYLGDEGEGALVRLPLGGGNPEVLRQPVLIPHQLFLLGQTLYYCEDVECTPQQIPKGGGKTTAPGYSDGWAFAPERDHVWVFGRARRNDLPQLFLLASDGTLTPKGTPRHLFMSQAAADDECLYYVRNDPTPVSHFHAVAKPQP